MEVLVAVLVMAIGLLGIALLQTHALAGNSSTMARTSAVIASYSILETMRTDRTNVLAGSYNKSVTGSNCSTTGTASYAAQQLTNWCGALTDQFGAVATTTGQVSCNAGICTVTITFDESRLGKNAGPTPNVPTSVVTRVAL